MIRELMKGEEEKIGANNKNNNVFNIIDDNNGNGELSGNNLEESDSSYSKSGNI